MCRSDQLKKQPTSVCAVLDSAAARKKNRSINGSSQTVGLASRIRRRLTGLEHRHGRTGTITVKSRAPRILMSNLEWRLHTVPDALAWGFSALRINLANRLSRSNKRQIDNSPELKQPEICSGSNGLPAFC